MNDNLAFMELSALLTGLYDPLLNDSEDRVLTEDLLITPDPSPSVN